MAESVPTLIRLMNPVTIGLLRMGIPMPPMILLTVRGRKTGRPYTMPVGMFTRGTSRWLFAQFGDVNWVRNLRATGRAELRVGRRREAVTATELGPEAAAVVLHDVVAPALKGPMGAMAGKVAGRPVFQVPYDAPVSEFIAESKRHPIFEVSASPAA
jgi:deazaflavin-dependent oxidoreductase (nitroreductase family)